MESQIVAQRDFSAGQLDETALRADDTDIMRAGLRTARNVRILASRSLARRPGRRRLFSVDYSINEILNPGPGIEWYMTLRDDFVIFRSKDLSKTVTYSGFAWTAAMLRDLRWTESGGVVILGHQQMRPYFFLYDTVNDTWAWSQFQFAVDPNGSIRQPFNNFVKGSGITMTPTARVGSITITFSAPVLNAAHVGVTFRYAGRQMVIAAVGSGTVADATVVEELPPAFTVNFDNVDGLQVGDVVEGVTSGARGQVAAIGGLAATILVDKNWSGFETGEIVAGPRSKMTVGSQSGASPVATTQWDEALMSDYRGWAGCIAKDAQRIIMTKFVQDSSAIVWSATGTLNDFLIGADKEDAIYERVPENCTVLDVVGGADEFVFTDKGTFYVPVSSSNPLIPGSIDFKMISDDPAAPVRPRATTEGLIFINAALTRVFAIVGTGQTTRPYVVEDLSEYHSDLIRQPIAMASSTADVSAPERYLYACNVDGTQAVARFQRSQTTKGWVGWVPWGGAGLVEWVAAGLDSVIVTVRYDTDAGTQRFVEVYDDDLLLDATAAVSTWPAGSEISVEKDGWYLGDYKVEADGSLSGLIPASATAGMNGGFNFEVEVEPFVPHVEGGTDKKQRLRRRRLKMIAAKVRRSQALKIGNKLVPFYRAGENEEVAPALRDEVYRTRLFGRDFDPRWSVKQELPGALQILELTSEVTI